MDTHERATFEVRESRRVFDGHIAAVRIDEVVMPGGRTADREVVEHVRAVAVLAVDDDENIVLIEQYRHPMRRRLWELPAGLMDHDDEPARAAAARELAEEVGIAADSWQVLADIASSPGFSTEGVRIYLARGLTRTGRVGEIVHEEADLRIVRLPLDDAVAAVLAGKIVNASAVAGILAARAVLGHATALRPGATPWDTGPATVWRGEGVGDAPPLPGASQGW